MPMYSYKCEKGHIDSYLRKYNDPAPPCRHCGATQDKQVTAPGKVEFNGPGFYETTEGKHK